jgi:hypothetical protein
MPGDQTGKRLIYFHGNLISICCSVMILLVTFFLEKKTCRPVGGVTKKFKDNPIAQRVCPANTTEVLNCFQRIYFLKG